MISALIWVFCVVVVLLTIIWLVGHTKQMNKNDGSWYGYTGMNISSHEAELMIKMKPEQIELFVVGLRGKRRNRRYEDQ